MLHGNYQNRKEWHEGVHIPLQHLAPDQADFVVIDPCFPKKRPLGFDYGYATAEPDSLVLWEAHLAALQWCASSYRPVYRFGR